MRNWLLTLLLTLVSAGWGWTFVVVKDAVAGYGVVSFLAIRFAIGSALLGAVSVRRITRKSLAVGGLIGVVLAAAYLFQTFGVHHTTATNCGLITGMFVVFAPVANYLLFGVRAGKVFWVAIAVSLVGLLLLSGAGPNKLAGGDLLTLGAAVFFGLHLALLDRHAKHHDAAVLATVQLATAALLFLAIWPLVDPVVWPADKAVWRALLITGVLASAVGFLVQTYVQQRLSAARTGIIISTEPVFAALFGYWLHHDRLTVIQILGAVLMVGAVLMAEIKGARD